MSMQLIPNQKVRIWYLDQHKFWRKKMTKFQDKDGGLTVDVKNKTYIVDRKAVTYFPTKLAQLGLGKGFIPTLIFYEECSVPITFNHEGCAHESSFAMNAFKRSTVVAGALKAAQKESNQELIKYGIIAMLIGIIVALIFLWQIVSKLGILVPTGTQ